MNTFCWVFRTDQFVHFCIFSRRANLRKGDQSNTRAASREQNAPGRSPAVGGELKEGEREKTPLLEWRPTIGPTSKEVVSRPGLSSTTPLRGFRLLTGTARLVDPLTPCSFLIEGGKGSGGGQRKSTARGACTYSAAGLDPGPEERPSWQIALLKWGEADSVAVNLSFEWKRWLFGMYYCWCFFWGVNLCWGQIFRMITTEYGCCCLMKRGKLLQLSELAGTPNTGSFLSRGLWEGEEGGSADTHPPTPPPGGGGSGQEKRSKNEKNKAFSKVFNKHTLT